MLDDVLVTHLGYTCMSRMYATIECVLNYRRIFHFSCEIAKPGKDLFFMIFEEV